MRLDPNKYNSYVNKKIRVRALTILLDNAGVKVGDIVTFLKPEEDKSIYIIIDFKGKKISSHFSCFEEIIPINYKGEMYGLKTKYS